MIGPGDHPNAAWPALAPGTVLDAVLETFDPRLLGDRDLVNAIAACERQASHLHAVQARMIAELMARGGAVGHPTATDADAAAGDASAHTAAAYVHTAVADSVGTALALEAGPAAARVSLAVDLVHNLSATLTALDAGRITLEKAGVIAERTRRLAPATRAAVEAVALERAPELSLNQLRRWLDDALSSAEGGGGSARSGNGA